MAWFKIAAKVLKALGLHRTILDRDEQNPYLERYYLFNTRWIGWLIPSLSYRIVLHNTKRSDPDGLHDHPWSIWGSRLLSGGYFEDTPEGRYWRSPKDGWRWRGPNDFHRLVLNPDCKEETWSLFIMGPKVQQWGFLDRDGNKVVWWEYLRNRFKYV